MRSRTDQDQKLIATETADAVAGQVQCLQRSCHRHQHLIAGGMAKAVVDLLESVHVYVQ